MELVYIVVLAVLALLGGLLAARLLRQSRTAEIAAKESREHAQQAESDIQGLRMAKLEVERRLASEEQKAARIPEFEKALTAAAGRIEQSRQARVAAESETAVAHESVLRLETGLADAKEHLAAAERARADLRAQMDALKDQMGQMEQSLAAKAEVVAQNEQATAELRQRLTAAETARDQITTRIDSALQAKVGAETTLARAAAQIQAATQRVTALEQELGQARGEAASRLDAAAQAKAELEAARGANAAQIEDKTQRLEALEEEIRQARGEAISRLDAVAQAKAELEAARGANTAQIEDKTRRLEALEEEFRQARGVAASRLDAATQAKAALEANLATSAALLQEKSQRLEALDEELRRSRVEAETSRSEIGDQRARLAALQEALEQERKHGAEKLALITGAREQMTQEFRTLAEEVIRRHSEDASRQNKAEIEVVLTPLRERLSEFQQGLLSAHDESAKERLALADQIRRLSDSSVQMASETQQLASMLKGKSEGLGAWGEVLLSSILERSGLREGEDYVLRESYSPDGSQRLRPDVVISLPADQRVVIDSKVPLAAFEAFANAGNDADRSIHLASHAAAMAAHIRALAERDPPPAAESKRDYTVMFVPVEGALAAAMREDPDLTGLAVEKNIALATPGTLMMALRSVANVWQAERRNRRAETIAERAGKLYDGFAAYLGDMELLGDHLVRARHSYEEALARLAGGRDNLIGQVEELREMGAKATKDMPRISAAERRFEAAGGSPAPEPANEDTIAGT